MAPDTPPGAGEPRRDGADDADEPDRDRTADAGNLPRDPATVRETYDRIAEHFAKTRHSPWPEVREFVDASPDGTVGLDVGCGNGRHAAVLAERVGRVLCVDVSRPLLAVAGDRLADGEAADAARFDRIQADAATLPVRDDRVDLAAYVATVHHLPDRSRRVASLDELGRVLAPGGRALVSAWATTHDRFDREEGFDTTVDWTLPDGQTVDRFYHVYDPDEFAADLAASDLRVRESWVSSGNCYAEVEPGSGAGD
ncbi:SAM-dependent methyltransferase [Halobacteriales archaeon QS_8_69_26]|nr:MAG: SAM-dependent methyltransferase [Halobacteriales archaeon QS_8_69_26]